jgi:Cu/Ag efflux pump CusA
VSEKITQALKRVGDPPKGIEIDVRGQIVPMRQFFGWLGGGPIWEGMRGLTIGLAASVLVILLLLTGYFQSLRLAFIVVTTAPAVIIGVVMALMLTRTTLNLQSFMGAIMAVGVAVANSILLVTFAERDRQRGAALTDAAVESGRHRLRPILMTSLAMIAGMTPMALALGEGGEQTAPLAIAVIGGLFASTLTTLFLVPSIFAVVQQGAGIESVSLDPEDQTSAYFSPSPAESSNRPGSPAAETNS